MKKKFISTYLIVNAYEYQCDNSSCDITIFAMNLKTSGDSIIRLLTKRYLSQQEVPCGSIVGVDDVAIYKSSSPEAVQNKKALQKYDHLSRSAIFRYLWMGVKLSANHTVYIL